MCGIYHVDVIVTIRLGNKITKVTQDEYLDALLTILASNGVGNEDVLASAVSVSQSTISLLVPGSVALEVQGLFEASTLKAIKIDGESESAMFLGCVITVLIHVVPL